MQWTWSERCLRKTVLPTKHQTQFHTQIFAFFRLPMRVTHDKERWLFMNAIGKRKHEQKH